MARAKVRYRVEFAIPVVLDGERIGFVDVDDFEVEDAGSLRTTVAGRKVWWNYDVWTSVSEIAEGSVASIGNGRRSLEAAR